MATYTYQLTMRTGPTPGKIFVLSNAESTIGRDTSNPIAIADPEISRRHGRVNFQGGYYVLEDFNSTNGTFVNGKRLVGQYVLQPGDVVNLGEHVTLVFESQPYDPDATQVTPVVYPQTEEQPQPVVPRTPSYSAAPTQYPPPAAYPPTQSGPMYVGQVPPGPDDFEPMPEQPPRNRSLPWILAGCGCLTMICVVALAALWYIDSNFLWCSIFPFIPGCP